MIKRLIPLLFLLAIPAMAQTPVQIDAQPGTAMRVCIFPEVGNPCTNQAMIFSDSGLTMPISQPVQFGGASSIGFFVTNGSNYRVQLSGAVTKQILVVASGFAFAPSVTGYGRWGTQAWSHQNGNFIQTGDFAQGGNTCTTSGDNGASATLPSNRTCGTGATANTTQIIPGATANDLRIGSVANPTNVRLVAFADMISATTTTRAWIAITDQTGATLGTSDTPAGNTAGFRFSSVAGDTNYMAVLCNAGTCVATSTGVTAVANAWHSFEIDLNDTMGTATFYIDGVLKNTLTTDYPAAAAVNIFQIIDNTTTTAETLGWAYFFESTIL